MIRADKTMHDDIAQAVEDSLIATLRRSITNLILSPILPCKHYRIGDIEDANILIQSSLWLTVPLGQLGSHDQVTYLYDRRAWDDNQLA